MKPGPAHEYVSHVDIIDNSNNESHHDSNLHTTKNVT